LAKPEWNFAAVFPFTPKYREQENAMQKLFAIAALALAASLAGAQAQQGESAPADPAKDLSTVNKQTAPEPGANSFTEAQARSRFEKNGFVNITALIKDGEGIWRGKATKDSRTVDVALDFKGNITAQ
jgi:periplasmic protein CpxP/Spy